MLAHEHGLGSETLSAFVDNSVDNVLVQTNPDFNQSLLEFINIPECLTLVHPCIQLDTLGHTPTPSVSVKSCHLCFFLGEPHLLYVFVDCAPPVRSWLTWSSLISWYLPVQCLQWYPLMVHTQNMSKPA